MRDLLSNSLPRKLQLLGLAVISTNNNKNKYESAVSCDLLYEDLVCVAFWEINPCLVPHRQPEVSEKSLFKLSKYIEGKGPLRN